MKLFRDTEILFEIHKSNLPLFLEMNLFGIITHY